MPITPHNNTISCDAQRSRLHRMGLRTENGENWSKRRVIIAQLADRGTPSQIAKFLFLYHGQKVSRVAVRKVIVRLRSKCNNRNV